MYSRAALPLPLDYLKILFGNQSVILVLLKQFLTHVCFVTGFIALLKEATAIREYCLNEKEYMVYIDA